MADLEVEVMLENHPHLFLVEVESVLEAQQLHGTVIQCGVCKKHQGKVTHVGVPSRKPRAPHLTSDKQRSIFDKEDR